MFETLVSQLLQKLAFVAPSGATLRPWLQRIRGVQIGREVWIGQLVYIDVLQPADVTIGENTTIGMRTSIFTHLYWGRRRETNNGKVTIRKDVFIGPHCVILPNVQIGDGAVIRAGTVVSRNVPPHVFWGAAGDDVLGIATVPLTKHHSDSEFTRGLRIRREGKTTALTSSGAGAA